MTNNSVTDTITYVGVDDTDIQRFENQYPVPHGMSYNSYIVRGTEKTALLDTVELSFGSEWLARVEDALGSAAPDYLVVHHMEPDHSSNIVLALDRWPAMKIVSSAKAIAMLPQFFEHANFDGRTVAVKEGESIDLGGRTLTFYAAPMVHWPEVVVSYDSLDKVLFSADAFGKFGALAYDDDWTSEARRYYVNIVGKYGAQTQALLKKAARLDIAAIAPLHGPVLTANLDRYIGLYDTWSKYEPETPGVLVAYASIYGGTRDCALAFAEMLAAEGVATVLPFDLCSGDVSEAVSQAFRLSATVLAAPTYDASLFPPMARFLHHLKLKNWRNRPVGIIENGSWAPISGKLMAEAVSAMPGITVAAPAVTIRSRMHDSDIPALRQLAQAIATAASQKA